jgi:hypothetical protein
MILFVIYLITLLSSLALGGWSVFLLKHFDQKSSKMIEGKKSLYVYLAFSLAGIALSCVLLIGTFF